MPKFIVTRDSYFRPLDYAELVRPVAHMQEAHNAAQEAYDKLSMETSALDRYISTEEGSGDEEARRLYDSYREKLSTLQDNLWKHGINAGVKRDLSIARNGYMQDVARIGKAIEARQERSKEYWDAYHKNPDLVLGKDPMGYGLDSYMRDDNFGRDWFSVDSAQFEKDVASDVKSRAQSMIRDLDDPNNVHKNPRLKAILTRIVGHGVTNDEISEADRVFDDVLDMTDADRAAYYGSRGVSDAAQILVETLINRYDSTGIRTAEGVSDEGKQKLIGRGKAGWNAGVMAPDIKDFNDTDYEMQQKMRLARYQAALANPIPTDRPRPARASRFSYETPGDDYQKAAKTYGKEFGEEDGKQIRVLDASTGERVSRAQAAERYYAGEARRTAAAIIGFDPGVKDRYKTGEITAKDGTVWETKYDPSIDAIRVRKKGDKTNWNYCGVSERGTEAYKEAIGAMQDAATQYAGSDVEREAKYLSPDRQRDIYKRDEVDFSVPLTDYANEYFGRPDTSPNLNRWGAYIAKGDTGKKYNERLGSELSGEFTKTHDDKNNIVFAPLTREQQQKLRSYKGTAQGIHTITRAGRLSEDAVDPRTIFLLDENGNPNISETAITEAGILSGIPNILWDGNGDPVIVGNITERDLDGMIPYIQFKTTEGKEGTYSADMLNRSEVNVLFRNAAEQLLSLYSGPAPMTIKERYDTIERRDEIIDWLIAGIYQLYGWNYATPVAGGTSDSNPSVPQPVKKKK